MGLKKLLGKQKAPKNIGENGPGLANGVESKYYLVFPELEGEPTFLLEDSTTIGSEDADVLIQDESVAPSHCSVILNHDVLSIIDHGSPEGTFVNKRKLSPGKMIILSPKDKLRIGEVNFVIVEREEQVPSAPQEMLPAQEMLPPNDIPAAEQEFPPSPPAIEPEAEEIEEVPDFENDEEVPEFAFDEEVQETPKSNGFKVVKKGVVTEAANGFLRTLGLICDLLLAGIIHHLASSDPAYREFMRDLPALAFEAIGPVYDEYLKAIVDGAFNSLPALENAREFASSFFREEYLFIIQFFLLSALLRFVGSLIFGATLGQCLVGIRGKGSFLAKRLLSPIRFLFGALFLPLFWIFDFPTLFSKRSLKEVLSFTHLHTPSNLVAIFSALFFIPVLALTMSTAPLWKNLKLPAPIPFGSMEKVELGVFDRKDLSARSEYFMAGLPGDKAARVLPQFNFVQRAGRKSLEPSLSFIVGEESLVKLELLKSVSLVDLFKSFSRSNPLAELKYPEIAGLVRDVSNTNKAFTDTEFPEEDIARDIQKLMKYSMGLIELDPDSIMSFLKENGPFFGGFVEFRRNLLELMGPGAKEFKMRQIGNAIQIVGDYSNGRKTIKRILPLNAKTSRVYQVSMLKGEDPSIIELIGWNLEGDTSSWDNNPLMAFVDSLLPGSDRENIHEMFQNVHQAYFDLAKASLMEDAPRFYMEMVKSLEGSLAVLKNSKALNIPSALSDKLTQNLNDILRALRERDLAYFGASAVGALE